MATEPTRLAQVLKHRGNRVSCTVDKNTFISIMQYERELSVDGQPILVVTDPVIKPMRIHSKSGAMVVLQCCTNYICDPTTIRFQDRQTLQTSLSDFQLDSLVQIQTATGKWHTTKVAMHLYTTADKDAFYFLDRRGKRMLWNLLSLFTNHHIQPVVSEEYMMADIQLCLQEDKTEAIEATSDDEFPGLYEELKDLPDSFFDL